MVERRISEALDRSAFETPSALLCSEATAERCHRRLVLEHLAERWDDIEVVTYEYARKTCTRRR
jgi:hypothetical protein